MLVSLQFTVSGTPDSLPAAAPCTQNVLPWERAKVWHSLHSLVAVATGSTACLAFFGGNVLLILDGTCMSQCVQTPATRFGRPCAGDRGEPQAGVGWWVARQSQDQGQARKGFRMMRNSEHLAVGIVPLTTALTSSSIIDLGIVVGTLS